MRVSTPRCEFGVSGYWDVCVWLFCFLGFYSLFLRLFCFVDFCVVDLCFVGLHFFVFA